MTRGGPRTSYMVRALETRRSVSSIAREGTGFFGPVPVEKSIGWGRGQGSDKGGFRQRLHPSNVSYSPNKDWPFQHKPDVTSVNSAPSVTHLDVGGGVGGGAGVGVGTGEGTTGILPPPPPQATRTASKVQ